MKRIVPLLTGVVLLGLLSSCKKDFHVERSIVIEAKPSTIYPHIVDFREWTHWSPWSAADSTMTFEYMGEQGVVGSSFSWTSENAGDGSLELTGERANQRIEYTTRFTAPIENTSDGFMELEPVDGGTEVTWGFDTRAPFFLKMDQMVGADFETGLALLKDYIDGLPPAARAIVHLDDMPATQYYGQRATVPFDSMQTFFATWFPALMGDVMADGLTPTGSPSAVYWDWDEETRMADMAAAIPVTIPDDYDAGSSPHLVIDLAPQTVTRFDHYGSYESMMESHQRIMDFMDANGLLIGDLVIEEYITDPMSEPDTSKWLTRITYLMP